jgi:hypothetical protein
LRRNKDVISIYLGESEESVEVPSEGEAFAGSSSGPVDGEVGSSTAGSDA